jgi:hypothetical protein
VSKRPPTCISTACEFLVVSHPPLCHHRTAFTFNSTFTTTLPGLLLAFPLKRPL